MKKRVLLILCMMFCAMLLAGCNVKFSKVNKNFEKDTLKEKADAAIETWFATDYSTQIDQYTQAIDYYDSMKDTFSSSDLESYQQQRAEWVKLIDEYKNNANIQKKYGNEMEKTFGKVDYTISSDSATVTQNIRTTKNKKIVFSVSFDEEGNQTELKVDVYKTLGQKMSKAGLNTVMSMAIVFCVLIFISLVIWSFKLIGYAQSKSASQPETPQVVATQQTETPVSEDLTDDLELVAVITAAIAAATESESADGLIVRSIVRR